MTKKDPRSALGWTAALCFLPVIGLIVYLIFGIGRSQSKAERIMHKLAEIDRKYSAPLAGAPDLKFADPEEECMANLGHTLTQAPLTKGNSVTPFHNGDEAYPAMIEAIDKARNHVFLSSYIFSYGHAAREFIKALVNAHNRGVDTRVIVDGVGALYSWKKTWKILAAKGVPTARFRPPSLFPPNFGINLRSHRKVLVCDNIGFTGGMNIADGDLLKLNPGAKNHIQDVQFRFEGDIVNQLRRAFLLNWGFCTDEITHLPPLTPGVRGDCACRVVVDGPGNDAESLHDLMCGAINIARQSVRIMTPYFLPPPALAAAIVSAAQRGVTVKIILPAKNNLSYMNWAMDRVLPEFIRAGAQVWYQPPPFSHAKLLAIDGFYSLVGSANMDSRSLLLNFELDVEIYDAAFHDRLANFMDSTIIRGERLTMEYFNSMPLLYKLRDAASWVFSPYF